MLNRYEVEGLEKDLFLGKEVAVVGDRDSPARAIQQMIQAMKDTGQISEYSIANGSSYIRTNTCGRLYETRMPEGLRGFNPDVLVVIGPISKAMLDELEYLLTRREVEVIRK